MPAEKVYGRQYPVAPVPENEEQPKPMVPIVDVRWGREQGFVQVVTKAEDAEGGRWMGDDYSVQAHVTDGLYVDLDRDQINRLIRNLRRARDQAFGRDE